jgi:hypothetical protein
MVNTITGNAIAFSYYNTNGQVKLSGYAADTKSVK